MNARCERNEHRRNAQVERHLAAIAEVAPELLDTYRALAERTRALAARREPAGGDREAEPEVKA